MWLLGISMVVCGFFRLVLRCGVYLVVLSESFLCIRWYRLVNI